MSICLGASPVGRPACEPATDGVSVPGLPARARECAGKRTGSCTDQRVYTPRALPPGPSPAEHHPSPKERLAQRKPPPALTYSSPTSSPRPPICIRRVDPGPGGFRGKRAPSQECSLSRRVEIQGRAHVRVYNPFAWTCSPIAQWGRSPGLIRTA